jgi:hypothetical protein
VRCHGLRVRPLASGMHSCWRKGTHLGMSDGGNFRRLHHRKCTLNQCLPQQVLQSSSPTRSDQADILVCDTPTCADFPGSSSPWTFLQDTRAYASRALPPHSPFITAPSIENHLSINAFDAGNVNANHFTPLPTEQANRYIDGMSLRCPC